MRVHKRIRYNYFRSILLLLSFFFFKESSCMELESMQIIYVIWHLWRNPKEIAQSTDISSLNVRKLNNTSIDVPGKMIKNNGRFTIHITSTVKKILRTCTGKQTIALEISLLQRCLLNFWDGEAPVECNSIICFP